MTAVDIALPRVKAEEGFVSHKYIDTRGFATIGYGYNIDAGITESAATALLTAQLAELHQALQTYRWYGELNEARQSVCIDIAFNVGLYGFVNGWPHLIAALQGADWARAQAECHTSTIEDEARYTRLGQILLTGDA